MPDTPNISEAEWEVIKIIWEKGPLTAGQIVAALEGQKHWRPRTIKTLLARLVKKGAVKSAVEEKRYVYRAGNLPPAGGAAGGQVVFVARV